jgi:hypothetical protein
MGPDKALNGLEAQVPRVIPGASQIPTDDLTPAWVLAGVKEARCVRGGFKLGNASSRSARRLQSSLRLCAPTSGRRRLARRCHAKIRSFASKPPEVR